MPSGTVRDGRDSVETHLAAAAEYLAIAESGDSEKSAYEHAADEIIAAKAEDSTLLVREIGERIGRAHSYVSQLVRWRTSGLDESPFSEAAGKPNRDASGARKIARERPDEYVEAFRQAPPEARQKIAEELTKSPEVRLAARKRDGEDARDWKPSEPSQPRGDVRYYQFESKLSSMEAAGRQALEILTEIDQPGDNQDTLDKIARIEALLAVIKEAYVSGKSLDTWSAELYAEENR